MAVADNALTSVSALKDYLGITGTEKDDLLESIINRVSDIIENYCGRTFKETTYTEEEYDGTGSDELLLENYPLTSSSITLEKRDTLSNSDNWSTIDSENYFVYTDEGKIKYLTNIFQEAPKHYRVTYTAGYSPIPDDLEEAALQLCKYIYNNKRSGGGKASESLGDYSVTYMKQQGILEDTGVADILDAYTDRRL